MHTNFFQYYLPSSFFLSRCFSLFLTSDEVWKLQRSCSSRNLTGCCAAQHQTLDDYAPMKVRPLANFFEVAFKSRASLWSVICDARPLLPRSTSGVCCSLLTEHGHGSLVHGRKPLFHWRLDGHFTHHWTAGRTKALSMLPSLKKKSGRKGVPDAFPARLRPAGSDPRVGDGLVWNPLPMAFKYTFLDRMQRS